MSNEVFIAFKSCKVDVMRINATGKKSRKINHVKKVTQFSLIDWSLIFHINRLVGINCYYLSILWIGQAGNK